MNDSEQIGESITEEGLANLRAEIAELEGPSRNAMAERIKEARSLGDLKENADYHIAKEDQAHLETKIKRLRERERDAVVVKVAKEAAVFAFGRTAKVLDQSKDKVSTWTLVGPTEANLVEGRLSVESPVGRALRDSKVGQDIKIETPQGEKVFRIEKLVD